MKKTAKRTRNIIEIDEEKCTGCGQCIIGCAEGALELVDGKARLVGEVLCDGLGACIGDCPEGALRIIEREADPFDEEVVEERLKRLREETAPQSPCGCPSLGALDLDPGPQPIPRDGEDPDSALGHWPIKLGLLGPGAPFLQGADLLLLADCVAAAYPALHQKLLPGRAVAMGCPKLDDMEAHIDRLAEIIRGAEVESLTVVHMEVPCCFGFVVAGQKAIRISGRDIPLRRVKISRTGELLEETEVSV
jgi:NAD-dependent dihydropyrimidine dehydrogenase PreA subunit